MPQDIPASTVREGSSPHGRFRIEIKLTNVKQLFNSLDPSPFIAKDLDNDAEEFIESWAKECPQHQPIEIVLHLREQPERPLSELEAETEQAIHNFFSYRTGIILREHREKLRQGRATLVIGLLALAASIGAGEILTHYADSAFTRIVRESLLIGGWVAMWWPMEIFLYGWWPLGRRKRILQKLVQAPVSIRVEGA